MALFPARFMALKTSLLHPRPEGDARKEPVRLPTEKKKSKNRIRPAFGKGSLLWQSP